VLTAKTDGSVKLRHKRKTRYHIREKKIFRAIKEAYRGAEVVPYVLVPL